MTPRLAVPATFAVLVLSALGSCSSGSSDGVSAEPSPLATSDAAPDLTEAEMIERAETLVEGSLPDAPIWKGMKFKGTRLDESAVCVDRTYRRGGGIDGKGGSAGYVTVAFPSEEVGNPQDGLCKQAAREPTATAAAPVEVPADVKEDPGLITRDDVGSNWPLTVPYGVLTCDNRSIVLAAPDGRRYAVNGTARDHTNLPDIRPIWADDPEAEGLKIDISPIIDRGLELCN